MSSPRTHIELLRSISFPALEAIHQRAQAEVKADPSLCWLIAAEPFATFTHGKNSDPSELLWTAELCAERGVGVVPVDRGGKWTYHGPGQLVLYPIIPLEQVDLNRRDVKGYLQKLRDAVCRALTQWGITVDTPTSHATEQPFGIYVGQKKLVSFGISVQHGVTGHGFAMNLLSQHFHFAGIVSCGVSEAQSTSLQELGVKMEWEDAAIQMIESIKKGFPLP